MAFWDWDRWEKEIDWMALNGINVALSIIGQEEVWRRTLLLLGYSEEECRNFICGPAFFPWQWMQNMTSWGGPIPDWWFNDRVELAKKIHNRMIEFGISPALQGYSGMIPVDFKGKYPNVNVIDQGLWCGFQRPSLLSPTDPMFEKVASVFYEEQRSLFGDDIHFYCADLFHEGGNTEMLDVAECTKIVQNKMLSEDNKAVWIIQAWGANPTVQMLEVLQKEHTLILDLHCESNPRWKSKNAFNKIPWVWCIISNFGGKQGLYGNLRKIAKEPVELINNPETKNMSGIGLLMEGIETNPVVFDLITDMIWRDQSPDIYEWLKCYIERRYGKFLDLAYQGWKLLADSIYNCEAEYTEGAVESIICARPDMNIKSVSTWGPKKYYFNKKVVREACKKLLECFDDLSGSDAFLYDLVDITRQVVADSAKDIYDNLILAYKNKEVLKFGRFKEEFLHCVSIQDKLLGTRKEFLLGKWLKDARMLAKFDEEKALFEFNARSLIIIWGPRESAESLHDYSHRQWSGLTADFYLKRWQIYFGLLDKALVNHHEVEPFDWFEWEYEWTKRTDDFQMEVSGDIKVIVAEILQYIEILGDETWKPK
jgi:alpha-N-acetylglucosaminidase